MLKRLIALPALLLIAIGTGAAANAEGDEGSCTRTSVEKVEGPEVWEPGPGGEQVPLWPEGLAIETPETDGNGEWTGNGSPLVAGRLWHWATYVSRPSMTLYSPKGENSGTTLLVLPGGGYAAVAMDLEGTEICHWATAQGMTCIVLKYRVPQVWQRDENGVQQAPEVQLPLKDAQRAMALLRHGGDAYGIDPDKIGVIGFSAGGHLAAELSNADTLSYDRVDAADDERLQPDFAILAYPGRLWDENSPKPLMKLAPWVRISKDAPPTLLIHAMNDPVDDVRHSIAYGLALSEAGVPVDMRLFADGCHAFGLRETSDPVTTEWPELAIRWLRSAGLL